MAGALYRIKKKYNYLGFKTLDLLGILILSMFLSYSIEYFYIEILGLLDTYFPSFSFVVSIDKFLEEYYIKEYFLNNFVLLTILLFLLQVLFFQNNKINLKKNIIFKFIDQAFQKLSLLVPLKQFATYMFISHISQLGISDEKITSDFSTMILLSSFILSTVIISLVPQIIHAINKWRRNHYFALNSGLIFHYNNIRELELDYEFTKFIKELGEVKSIKISGITGKNTFVTKDSYMNKIFDPLQFKKSNKPKIRILLSKKDSKGLLLRSKSINTPIHILNEEIDTTLAFINKNDILNKYSKIKYYSSEPKYKMILIEGSNNCIVLLQAYLDKNNILDEQIYIYEDKFGTSMYKIINEAYNDLHKDIK